MYHASIWVLSLNEVSWRPYSTTTPSDRPRAVDILIIKSILQSLLVVVKRPKYSNVKQRLRILFAQPKTETTSNHRYFDRRNRCCPRQIFVKSPTSKPLSHSYHLLNQNQVLLRAVTRKKLITEAMSMEDLWLRQSVHGWVLFPGIKSVYSDKSERNYRGKCFGWPVRAVRAITTHRKQSRHSDEVMLLSNFRVTK